MQKYQDIVTIIGPPGLIPIVGANVAVYNQGTSTAAAIFSSNSSTLTANPLTTDSSGRYSFYAADGRYDLRISGTGIQTTTLTDIELSDTTPNLVNLLAASSGSLLVGYTQGGTGALTKTVQSKLRNTIDLNDYAACDGQVDDTAQINQLIANLPSTGGTIRYSGTPLFSSTITVNKKISFLGDGGIGTTVTDLPSSYFLKSSALNGPGFNLSKEGIIMQGGGIVGQVGNGGDNVVLLANSVTLRDFTLARAGQDNCRVGKDAVGGNSNSVTIDNVHSFSAVRRNLYVHSGDLNANVGTLINFQSLLAGEDGVLFDKCTGWTAVGVLSESCVGKGLHATLNAQNLTIVGGDREANGSTNVLIDVGAQNVVCLGYFGEVTDNTVGGMIRPDRLFMKMGTWTPVFAGSATPGTQTYSAQTGTFIKMGDMMFITCLLTLSALDAATAGNINITGLPSAYAGGFTNGVVGCSIVGWGGFTLTGGYTDLTAEITAGSQQIQLLMNGSAQSAAFVTKAMASSTSNIQLSAWYPINKF